jgi:hypothetical protein
MASSSKLRLTPEEIAAPFTGAWGEKFPPVLSRDGLAALFGVSPKTIDDWKTKGRLAGSFRKNGKRVLFWRDRAIKTFFNGAKTK